MNGASGDGGQVICVHYLFHDNICNGGCGVDMPDILPYPPPVYPCSKISRHIIPKPNDSTSQANANRYEKRAQDSDGTCKHI